MQLRWITDPPVTNIEGFTVISAANFIEERGKDATKDDGIDIDQFVRMSDICEDMRILARDERKSRDFEFYVYGLAGAPVALMSIYCPEFPPLNDGRMSALPQPGLWVEGTVGSPYVTGAGVLMKEVAVNLSQNRGYKGCVGSAAASDEAKATWERMGFRDTGRVYKETIGDETNEYPIMFLNPERERKTWGWLNNRWKFLPLPLTREAW